MPTTVATSLRPSAFLHLDEAEVYNPLTDLTLGRGDRHFPTVHGLASGEVTVADLGDATRDELLRAGWLTERDDLDRSFLLKHVSLESYALCNQACYFCPVAYDPRDPEMMPAELYRSILDQLSEFRGTLLGVTMSNYNEPTADPRFVDQVRWIREAGFGAAVLTNASGLTPDKVDRVVELGGLLYLQVNLSTLDRRRYGETRGEDHLATVLRNLDHARDLPVAETMEIIVLGTGDRAHAKQYRRIRSRFAGSRFEVTSHRIMDRAGYLSVGLAPSRPHGELRGCANLGSRPLQHLHITATGTCVLCCEDYDENHVVGDLNQQTVREVLEGPELQRYRRWIYGLEDAPEDFICRYCVFARTES